MTLNDYKLSLVHHIQARFLSFYGYDASITGERPSSLGGNAYQLANRNLKFADASGSLVSYVSVYDNGVPLAASGAFDVNYVDSTVMLASVPSGTVTVDYRYNTVAVLDSFPDNETFDTTDLPLLAIGLSRQSGTPFALGMNSSIWRLSYVIDLFARNDPMRMALTGQLTDFLSKEPFRLIDFGQGYIINFDGTLNTGFNPNTNTVRSLHLPQPSAELLNMDFISDKEKYRTLITGVVQDIY